MSLKRFMKPASVQEAKSAAERLKDFLSSRNIAISRSLALEGLSVAAGYRDWNTFHGVLMQPDEIREEVTSIEMAKINRAFFVEKGLEEECIEALRSLCKVTGFGADMWRSRIDSLLANVVKLHFMMSEHEGRAPSLVGIRETMSISTFCDVLMRLQKEAPAANLLPFYAFLETIPGLKLAQIRGEEDMSDATVEQWGFAAMQLSKPIGLIIDC